MMIGFLKKDVYALISLYRKNLLLVYALYTVLFFVTDNLFFLYFMIWLMGFYALSAISLDDGCGWDRYARTLPAATGQIVGARYLVAIGMVLAGAVLALLIGAASTCFRGGSPAEMAATVPLVSGIALAMIGLLLPAAYKWGVEKARNGFLALFLLVFLVPLLMEKGILNGAAMDRAFLWLEAQPPALPAAAALGLGLLACAAGFAVSCRIYRGKEF